MTVAIHVRERDEFQVAAGAVVHSEIERLVAKIGQEDHDSNISIVREIAYHEIGKAIVVQIGSRNPVGVGSLSRNSAGVVVVVGSDQSAVGQASHESARKVNQACPLVRNSARNHDVMMSGLPEV